MGLNPERRAELEHHDACDHAEQPAQGAAGVAAERTQGAAAGFIARSTMAGAGRLVDHGDLPATGGEPLGDGGAGDARRR